MPEFEGPSELTCSGGFLPAVPVDESVAGPGAYEDVADGAQTGGLGKSDKLGCWGRLQLRRGWGGYGGRGLTSSEPCGRGCSKPGGPGGLRMIFHRLPSYPHLSFFYEPYGALPLPGFNLRIGRPKGPRDPPAEWTRV